MSRECISTRDPLDKNTVRSVLIMHGLYPSTSEGIASLASRFWAKVNKDGPVPEHCPELGPCWVWTAYTAPQGDDLDRAIADRQIILGQIERFYGFAPDGCEVMA